MMVAAEVPMATWAYSLFMPPRSGRMMSIAGTTTKPPPTPNMPAVKPANRPAPSRATRGMTQ